jgi:hypothetical protein
MNQIISRAIQTRSILEFEYNGHRRVVEPHAYGLSKKSNEILRGYQIEGTTHAGIVPEWFVFEVGHIRDMKMTDRHFEGMRYGYQRGDKSIATIYAEL